MGNAPSNQGEHVLEERPLTPTSFTKLLESPSLVGDALFGAVLSRDLGRLRTQIGQAGAASRREQSQGFSAVHFCCILQWAEGLQEVLQAGCPADMASNAGYVPLHLAAYLGWGDGCRALLEHGARWDMRSRRGALPIHLAAQQPSTDVLAQLLASGGEAAVDTPGYRNRTPLHLAVLSHGNPAVVRLLIDAGANTSRPNAALHGITPLHTAAHHGRVEAMRLLLEAAADPNAKSDDGISPLLELFAHPGQRHSEESLRTMFSLLRDAGADVNCMLPHQGYTVLHFCVTACNEEPTLELLLDSGVDARVNTNRPLSLFDPRSKATMLHKAAKRGWTNVARRLIGAGADLTLRDRDGLQPLHTAVISKRVGMVDVLLRAGANPNARCANMYPSYSHWKMQRGMHAIQAMMDVQPEGFDALAQLLQEPEEEMTAVDLACCVAQWLPSVEVFRKYGALPSAEALSLAEQDTPIMRTVVERPLWTPELHKRWPPRFKAAVQELLRCLCCAGSITGVDLPESVVHYVIHKAAYPVSRWADVPWLLEQRVRQPEPVGLPGMHAIPGMPIPGMPLPPGAAAAAGEGAAGGGLGGLPLPLPLPPLGAAPAGLANAFQQVFQQLQQGLVDLVGNHPHGEDEGEDSDQEEEGEGAGGLGQGGDHPMLGGFLGGAGLPPNLVPQAVHQQALGPNVQVIHIEFNMPLAQLMGGGPGPMALGGPGGLGLPGMPGLVFHAGPIGGLPPFPPMFPFMGGDDEEEEEDSEDEELPLPPGPGAAWHDAAAAAAAAVGAAAAAVVVAHVAPGGQQEAGAGAAVGLDAGGAGPAAAAAQGLAQQPAQGLAQQPAQGLAQQPADSMPGLIEDTSSDSEEEEEEEEAGPSSRAGSKRSGGRSGGHYDLRPRKKQKRE